MWAMSLWSKAPLTQTTVMTVDRWLDGAASVLPFAAIVLALRRRRGRRLAAVALLGTALALAAALVDASGQDRHAVGFRVVAFGIALMSLTVASTRRAAPADDLEIDDLEIDDLEIDDLAEFEADMRVDTGADLEPA
jgi:peptidoglycan/LPS O-acetylase OafA/YrhL